MNSPIPMALLASSFALSAAAQDTLETITVSTTRQPEIIMDVDRSLYLLTEQQISDIDAQHINQTLARVPAAWISRGNGQEHLTAIRSPVLTGAGGCGAFFIAQDGIGGRAPGFCNANQLFDLNTEQAGRIEVLNGPASVAYGSNAVHGVVNVLTPSAMIPNSDYLALLAGPHQYKRAKFNVSTENGEQGFMIYGNLSDDGGYQDSSGYQQQKLNAVLEQKHGNWQQKIVAAYSNLSQQTAGFVQGFESYEDPVLRRSNPNPDAYRKAQSGRLYGQFTYRQEATSELVLSPYVRWAKMEFLQHYLPWQSTESNRQFSVGLQSQFNQQFEDVSLTSGFDADFTRGELQEFQQQPFSPTIPQGMHYDYQVDAQVLSPFAMLNYAVNQRWSVRVGSRFEYTRYAYTNHLTDGNACEAQVENCRFSRPEDDTLSYSQWSYHAGLHYQLDDSHGTYLQFSKGYRAPQATELFRLQAGQQNANLDAETLDSIELGLKGSSDNSAYQFSLFTMQKRNFIFQDTNRQNISNGETAHRGIEAQLHYRLPYGVSASFSGSYAKHTYENDIAISNQSIKGNLIDTAPKWLASAQINWQSDSGHRAELEWIYQDQYFLDPANTAKYDGHQLLNARATFAIFEGFELNLRLINLLDVDYAERADYSFGNYRYFIGEPRSVYVGVKWQWQD